MKHLPPVAAITAFLFTPLACSLAGEVVFADFEPPLYQQSELLAGKHGWVHVGSNDPRPHFAVTPDVDSGVSAVLDGTQSASIQSLDILYRPFSTMPELEGRIGSISWMQASAQEVRDERVSQGLFLGNDKKQTPAGIVIRKVGGSTRIWVFGKLSSSGGADYHDTGVEYLSGGRATPELRQVYRFTMEFDFLNQTMTPYYEDPTVPGERVQLHEPLYLASPQKLTAERLFGEYGIALTNTNVAPVVFDRITIAASIE